MFKLYLGTFRRFFFTPHHGETRQQMIAPRKRALEVMEALVEMIYVDSGRARLDVNCGPVAEWHNRTRHRAVVLAHDGRAAPWDLRPDIGRQLSVVSHVVVMAAEPCGPRWGGWDALGSTALRKSVGGSIRGEVAGVCSEDVDGTVLVRDREPLADRAVGGAGVLVLARDTLLACKSWQVQGLVGLVVDHCRLEATARHRVLGLQGGFEGAVGSDRLVRGHLADRNALLTSTFREREILACAHERTLACTNARTLCVYYDHVIWHTHARPRSHEMRTEGEEHTLK